MLWRAIRQMPFGIASRPQATTLLEVLRRRPFSLSSSDPSIVALLGRSPDQDTQHVTAVGQIRTIRNQKHITFLELGDGSTTETLQAILQPKLAHGLSTGTSVAVSGRWQAAPASAKQEKELHAENVRLLGKADESYPIQKKYHSPEYLRTIPHLRLRTPLNAVQARLRSEADYSLSAFFRDAQYIRVQPPVITSSDCEGAGEVFRATENALEKRDNVGDEEEKEGIKHGQYFKSQKYLTVSSQLHLEAFVHEHPKVWTLSPTFRAEKSDTPRHLSEFWMLEAECRTESLDEVMDITEAMLRALVGGLQETSVYHDLMDGRFKASRWDGGSDSDNIESRWNLLMRPSWPRVRFIDAIARLAKAAETGEASFEHKPSWGGLHFEHEKWIAEKLGQGSPVFVTHYPKAMKPFYMLPSNEGEEHSAKSTVACFDLLLPEAGEIVGGSLREHRLDSLLGAMQLRQVNLPSSTGLCNLDWYIDLRRYGSVPHGGFGLGLDRLLGYLAGVNNVKDVVPWPRHYGRCDC